MLRRHIDPSDPVIPFQFHPRGLCLLLERHGVDLTACLQAAGIDPSLCREDEALISYQQYTLLIIQATCRYPVPWLGLDLGRQLHLGYQGPIGLAALTSATLRQAAAVCQRYYHVLGPLLSLETRFVGDDLILQVNEGWDMGPLRALGMECFFVGLYDALRDLLGVGHLDSVFHFAYPAPAYAEMYAQMLGNPCLFGQVAHQMRLSRHWLDEPPRLAQPATFRLALAACDALLERTRHRGSIVTQLRRLPVVSEAGVLSVEQAAQRLYMSERTLKRQLARLATTYQKVVDDVRLELAAELLSQSDCSVAEVSERLFFSDVANFRRAFRRWTGMAPSEFREKEGRH